MEAYIKLNNNINQGQSFKGILELRVGNLEKPTKIVLSNANDKDMLKLSKKHDVQDTMCRDIENNNKILNYLKELSEKTSIDFSKFGKINSFSNRGNLFQIVGENATLQFMPECCNKTIATRKTLSFNA